MQCDDDLQTRFNYKLNLQLFYIRNKFQNIKEERAIEDEQMNYYEMLYAHRLILSNRKFSGVDKTVKKNKNGNSCGNLNDSFVTEESEGTKQKKHFYHEFLEDMNT
jgi:hypothetical protein